MQFKLDDMKNVKILLSCWQIAHSFHFFSWEKFGYKPKKKKKTSARVKYRERGREEPGNYLSNIIIFISTRNLPL